jgi:hypothetical protein
MRTTRAEFGLVDRAAEALKAVLGAISSVRLTGLKCEPRGVGRAAVILAHIEVLGRNHTLTCEVSAHGNPRQLKVALSSLPDDVACQAHATRVIIAPYLSPEAQALCKETNISFIDFEGNARIALGETFISKRTMQPRMRTCVPFHPFIIEEVRSRPPAPTISIASNIPDSPVRVREGATAGIAVV